MRTGEKYIYIFFKMIRPNGLQDETFETPVFVKWISDKDGIVYKKVKEEAIKDIGGDVEQYKEDTTPAGDDSGNRYLPHNVVVDIPSDTYNGSNRVRQGIVSSLPFREMTMDRHRHLFPVDFPEMAVEIANDSVLMIARNGYSNYYSNAFLNSKGVFGLWTSPLTKEAWEEQILDKEIQIESNISGVADDDIEKKKEVYHRALSDAFLGLHKVDSTKKDGLDFRYNRDLGSGHSVFSIPGKKMIFDVNDSIGYKNFGRFSQVHNDWEHPLARRRVHLHRYVEGGDYEGACHFLANCLSGLYHDYFQGKKTIGLEEKTYFSKRKNREVTIKNPITQRRFSREEGFNHFLNLVSDDKFKANDLALLNFMVQDVVKWSPEIENVPDDFYRFTYVQNGNGEKKEIAVGRKEFERIGKLFTQHVPGNDLFKDYFEYKKQKNEQMRIATRSTSSVALYDNSTLPVLVEEEEPKQKRSKTE